MLRVLPHVTLSVLCAGAALVACQPQVIGAPEVPQSVRERDAGEATAPAPDTKSPEIPDDVEVDLGPHGIAATLTARKGARASATPEGVRLQTADGFDLEIGHGGLDHAAEMAELVRSYGSRFERFLEENEHVVSWEVSTPTGSEYRFFASFPDAPLPYHCRTGAHAADSPQMVAAMIDVCRSVHATP